MEVVLGLGSAGCNVARKFEEYSQYKVYTINHELQKKKNHFRVDLFENPEQYEEQEYDFCKKLKSLKDKKVLFIVCGASCVASLSLVVLESLKKINCEVTILYISPEKDLLSEVGAMQERMVMKVLQQYARSGLFSNMALSSNVELENIVQNLTILNYHDTLNSLLCSTIHMTNVFKNTKSISDTFSRNADSSRISTFGFLNVDTGEEKLFFPLDNIREKRYYYAIPQKKLENESNLFRKIVNQVKENLTKTTKVSYGIYSTDYDESYVYIECFSSRIQ